MLVQVYDFDDRNVENQFEVRNNTELFGRV